MVVRVGGSFAYLAGDGMLTFDDHVRTVGDLRIAIEKTTSIPGRKQVGTQLVLRPTAVDGCMYMYDTYVAASILCPATTSSGTRSNALLAAS